MLRHDRDQWDIASSVGLTALGVAAARAIETHRNDALIHDLYAAAFVHAAQTDVDLPTTLAEAAQQQDPDAERVWAQSGTLQGLRTRFSDEFFDHACQDGARQAVILAAGLDTRAYRLDWPTGCTVFEIDQPQVLQFKDQVLTHQGGQPGCARRTVPIDLRQDWPAALQRAGFDRDQPTAWLAEGLLPYLPGDAEQRLLAAVHHLSAPGSRIALDHLRALGAVADETDAFQHLSQQVGIDDVRDLFYDNSNRADPDAHLQGWGWTTRCTLGNELPHHDRRSHVLEGNEHLRNLAGHIRYITAHRTR